MYDHEIDLIKYETIYDDLGNPENKEIKQTILCRVAEVGSTEFYQAKATDLKPAIKFIVKQFEYSGEKIVRFDGQDYRVMRTYTEVSRGKVYRQIALKFDEVELTCEKVVGDE